MTLPANSKAFSQSLPPQEAQEAANHLLEVLAKATQGKAELFAHPTEAGERVQIDLHPLVSDALMEVLRLIGSGDAVTLMPINKQLTTKQAADVLNVSRPYLIKLLEAGEIPYTKVGRHRRISAKDVFDFKDKNAAIRRSALDKLTESDADLL